LNKIRDLEQVVDVAARIFAEKGYTAARLEDVAAELGVLKGSLYYYISGKNELFVLVLQRRLTVIVEKVQQVAASGASPTDKLVEAMRLHLHYLAAYSPESSQWFHPELVGPVPQVDGEGPDLQRRYKWTFANILREGVAEGEFRDDLNISVATMGVLGVCNWPTQWYRNDGPQTIEEICDTLIPMVVDGLRSKGRTASSATPTPASAVLAGSQGD
jgi:AcrR family transcriptional regulator